MIENALRDTLDPLRDLVARANLDLVSHGLVLGTWGNASAVDRSRDLMLIKPSGVAYDGMSPGDMVAVRLSSGEVLPGNRYRPSSDAPTHLSLYRAWPEVGGIVHTHSEYGTSFAQAGHPIPTLGTTHADYFHGDIPCTRALTMTEIAGDYEANTGDVIRACFSSAALDPLAIPGVLVAQHAPFAWGANVSDAVQHAVVLERLARMALHTLALNPAVERISPQLLARHFSRKHGPRAYYGQQRPS
jgi:L-ribulose-5-phosphate 4-epimerase